MASNATDCYDVGDWLRGIGATKCFASEAPIKRGSCIAYAAEPFFLILDDHRVIFSHKQEEGERERSACPRLCDSHVSFAVLGADSLDCSEGNAVKRILEDL